jgi:1-deoxy-D-xylulose-5-phosphate synthase
MQDDEKVCVMTAAMCAGNDLGAIRNEFPERFFDTGICEGHAVAFAGGMAKSGMRPIVDIYSTFLQRSFDQIFQEVALQNLPVLFCLDRAGLCGPDGPTHHGVFDNSYMRIFPNMVVMAPGDELDVKPMLDFALSINSPTSIRYAKTSAEKVTREVAPIELGRSEVLSWGEDGNILACGVLLSRAVEAAALLRAEGLDVGVVNARFVKPVDEEVIRRAIQAGFVITVEESARIGGFGSAVLEAANGMGESTDRVKVLAIPDEFVEHGDRDELLADLGLDAAGIAKAARQLAKQPSVGHASA